jgi:hypothetical protein
MRRSHQSEQDHAAYHAGAEQMRPGLLRRLGRWMMGSTVETQYGADLQRTAVRREAINEYQQPAPPSEGAPYVLSHAERASVIGNPEWHARQEEIAEQSARMRRDQFGSHDDPSIIGNQNWDQYYSSMHATEWPAPVEPQTSDYFQQVTARAAADALPPVIGGHPHQ